MTWQSGRRARDWKEPLKWKEADRLRATARCWKWPWLLQCGGKKLQCNAMQMFGVTVIFHGLRNAIRKRYAWNILWSHQARKCTPRVRLRWKYLPFKFNAGSFLAFSSTTPDAYPYGGICHSPCCFLAIFYLVRGAYCIMHVDVAWMHFYLRVCLVWQIGGVIF